MLGLIVPPPLMSIVVAAAGNVLLKRIVPPPPSVVFCANAPRKVQVALPSVVQPIVTLFVPSVLPT
jgi:hypothetical protein